MTTFQPRVCFFLHLSTESTQFLNEARLSIKLGNKKSLGGSKRTFSSSYYKNDRLLLEQLPLHCQTSCP